jgi:alginate O-acetyltransferase complex protein AlgJ
MRPRYLIVALAAVFLFTPLALLATGYHAPRFENRPLTPAPKPSAGWKFFDQATQYLVDRLPLRKQAVRANAWVDEHVWNTTPRSGNGNRAGALPFGVPAQDRTPAKPAASSPSNQVLRGKDGWLYLQADIAAACTPGEPIPQALATYSQLAAVLRASGRPAEIVIVPNKTTIYPEHLPPGFPGDACASRGRDALWNALEHSPPPHVHGLRTALLAAKAAHRGQLVYRVKDTHWNRVGATAMAQFMVEAAGGRRVSWAPRDVVRVPDERFSPDLAQLLGTPTAETAPAVTVVRPGAGRVVEHDTKLASGDVAQTFTHVGATAPLIPGTTYLLGDSFSLEALSQIVPYFSRLVVMNWGTSDRTEIVGAMQSADRVFMEVAERDAADRPLDGRLMGGPGLKLLQRGLRPRH